MEKLIKIILAILLLMCLIDFPYGFYQFVRFTALVGFGILAFKAFEEEKQIEMIIYLALALLFQPIVKISLGRTLWNIVDIAVALYLLYDVLIKKESVNGE
jgi:hypothetical protein